MCLCVCRVREGGRREGRGTEGRRREENGRGREGGKKVWGGREIKDVGKWCISLYPHPLVSHTTLCWWCSSPSEVELGLKTTFERDKKRFQYADVHHDGGVDNEEFIYFLHPEYNKEAVRGEGRGSEFECVCVCVCVCPND